jgi:hypothetical protein
MPKVFRESNYLSQAKAAAGLPFFELQPALLIYSTKKAENSVGLKLLS